MNVQVILEKYPNKLLEIPIWKENRAKFSYDLQSLDETNVCVTGTVKEYRGKPEIVVTNPNQIAKQ